MSRVETATDRGFLLEGREWKAIGRATVLMILNVVLMYVFVVTPLAAVNRYLFAYPTVGVLVYGAAITGGQIAPENTLSAFRNLVET